MHCQFVNKDVVTIEGVNLFKFQYILDNFTVILCFLRNQIILKLNFNITNKIYDFIFTTFLKINNHGNLKFK
jgi:hypothetical protein